MAGGALRCVVVVVCCLALLHVSTALPAQAQDYEDVMEWMLQRGLERRAQPSMRLRFGKRDMGWQVAQRSMPSLRLRFGKRAFEEEEPLMDHDLVRKDSRQPALRLRFGKRDSSFEQGEEGVAAQDQ